MPSLREYNRIWGVTSKKLDAAPRDLLILHPGPMNRGVEIDSDVADGPHSVILNQVTNGVAIRMAVLYLLAGGQPEKGRSREAGSRNMRQDAPLEGRSGRRSQPRRWTTLATCSSSTARSRRSRRPWTHRKTRRPSTAPGSS